MNETPYNQISSNVSNKILINKGNNYKNNFKSKNSNNKITKNNSNVYNSTFSPL